MVTGIPVARTHDAGDVIGAVEQLLQPTLPSSLSRVRYLTAGRAFAHIRPSSRLREGARDRLEVVVEQPTELSVRSLSQSSALR